MAALRLVARRAWKPRRPISAGCAAAALSARARAGGAAGVAAGAAGAEQAALSAAERRQSLRRVLLLARPEVRLVGASVGTLFVTSGISLLFPQLIGQVLDLSLTDATGLSPPLLVGGLAGLFVVQGGLIVARSAMLSVAGERLIARLRKQLFAAVLAQEQAFFDATRTGELVNRLSADTQLVQRSVTGNLVQGLRASFMAVGATGMLFYTSPTLAFVSLSVIPPVGLAARRFGQTMKKRQAEVQDALAETSTVAEEVIGNSRTVRQFAGEPLELAKYSARIDAAYRKACQVGLAQAWFDGSVHLAANFSLVAVLGYGGSLVYNKEITAGALTSFLMYSLYVGFNVTNIGTAYSDLMKGAGASARIFNIIDKVPEMPGSVTSAASCSAGASASPAALPDSVLAAIYGEVARPHSATPGAALAPGQTPVALAPAAPAERPPLGAALFGLVPPAQAPGERLRHVTPFGTDVAERSGYDELRRLYAGKQALQCPPIAGAIRFANVSFAYPQRPDALILDGLSLELEVGKSLAVVGASGSGKSTLGHLLTRLYDPQSGSISIDGVDVKDMDPHWLRRHVGVVAQEPTLFSSTIEDNIRYGNPAASMEQIVEAARNASALQFIEAFPDKFKTRVGERGLQLSGGQKQRVAIARAMLKDPPIAVLDEATSALDSSSEYLVQQAIERMMKGRTVLTIAHRLSTFKKADRIAVLEGGRVVELGTHEELVRNKDSRYLRLVQKQLAPGGEEGLA
jgi:ABC-type multidrug transport system fused ATPase/permease subunit